MKKHRFIVFAVAACFVLHAPAGSAAAFGWLDNYHKAEQEAKTSNKLLLLNFTGSDWCGWCIKLDKDVFSSLSSKITPAKIWSSCNSISRGPAVLGGRSKPLN